MSARKVTSEFCEINVKKTLSDQRYIIMTEQVTETGHVEGLPRDTPWKVHAFPLFLLLFTHRTLLMNKIK